MQYTLRHIVYLVPMYYTNILLAMESAVSKSLRHTCGLCCERTVYQFKCIKLVILLSKKVPRTMAVKVFVVGGGISGLAAAAELASSSEDVEVTVFEASPDRAGGRIRAELLDGEFVELGAQWIHGSKGGYSSASLISAELRSMYCSICTYSYFMFLLAISLRKMAQSPLFWDIRAPLPS